MPRVLVIVDHYLPGYKAGGPVRSIANMVAALGTEMHFSILTKDRDFGDPGPYKGVSLGAWQMVNGAEVFYARRTTSLRRVIQERKPQIIYLNSLFSSLSIRVLLLGRLRLIEAAKIVIAPRGELAPGALQFRRWKKRLFLVLARWLRLFDGVVWQATNVTEATEIEGAAPSRRKSVFTAPVFTTAPSTPGARVPKRAGLLRAIFASRISPKKNLQGLLSILAGVRCDVRLDICGPFDDEAHWNACQNAALRLPSNVVACFRGPLPPEELQGELNQSDLFILPTWGENHGHVIVEALTAACPVLISDRTPWRSLEQEHAGWDLPIDDDAGYRQVIELVAAMSEEEHRSWREGALTYGLALAAGEETRVRYRSLFSLEDFAAPISQ